MKIVVINGQNHKGSTYHIGKILADAITSDKQIKEFFLPRDLNHFCAGCYTCIEDEKKCPYYSEKNIIMQEVERADVLIFTTPNYCMAPSAPMKSFMDLTFTYWLSHKPRECMFRKKAVVISTTAGMGAKTAIKPITKMLSYWGLSDIGKYGIAVQAKSWDEVSREKKEKISKEINKIAKEISNNKKPKSKIKTKIMFYLFRSLQKADFGSSPIEKQYWEDKGWLRKERPWKKS